MWLSWMYSHWNEFLQDSGKDVDDNSSSNIVSCIRARPRMSRGQKKHKNFFNINFLAPTQNPPFWALRKKFMCLISWERTQKGTHINFFGGIFGVRNGVPNGPFSATKSLVYCFFPALNVFAQKSTPNMTGRRFHRTVEMIPRPSLVV